MKRISKYRIMARQIALEAVRDTFLEDLHAGQELPKKYRDDKYSRITDDEMRKLMLEVEEKLRICLWAWDKKKWRKKSLPVAQQVFFGKVGISWDRPREALL